MAIIYMLYKIRFKTSDSKDKETLDKIRQNTALKWNFFPKKVNFFRPPKLGAKSPPMGPHTSFSVHPLHFLGLHLCACLTFWMLTLAYRFCFGSAPAGSRDFAFVRAVESSSLRLRLKMNVESHNSFIHSGYFYSAPSSPLLLRGAPDYSTDTVSEFHA